MNIDEEGKKNNNRACGVHVKYDYRRLQKRYYMTRFDFCVYLHAEEVVVIAVIVAFFLPSRFS